MNLSTFTGRIATDLELKQTQSGRSVLPFTIAVQRDFKNKSTNEYDSDFIRCLASGATAEFLNNYASKGYMIGVNGRMQNNNFTKQDGTQVESMQLIVNSIDSNILFLNKNENSSKQNTQSNNFNQQSQTQRGQAQNGWQQQQQNNQQGNPFANANGPIDIDDDDLPF